MNSGEVILYGVSFNLVLFIVEFFCERVQDPEKLYTIKDHGRCVCIEKRTVCHWDYEKVLQHGFNMLTPNGLGGLCV